MRNLLLSFLFIFNLNISSAQVADTAFSKPIKTKAYQLVPMPVIGLSPTSGFIIGAAASCTFKADKADASGTSMSNFLANALLTTRNQKIFQIRGTTFFKNDDWVLPTDLRFNANKQPTYGLGTRQRYIETTYLNQTTRVSDNIINAPPEKEMMQFNHARLYQTALRRYKDSRLFVGMGYHLDAMWNIQDPYQNVDTNAPKLSYHQEYQLRHQLPLKAYAQSGVSIDFVFDSRDNILNAYKGRFINTSFRYNPKWMGSTHTATQVWLEYRDYFNLSASSPRHLIALWSYTWVVASGKVPYMLLPATGWDLFGRSGRPHTSGRFRGENLSYTETEWRFPLPMFGDKFGGVAFVNASSASYSAGNVQLFDHFQFGYGAGLRYMVNTKIRANISLDYGRGVNGASGFFLNINEMF